MTSETKRFDLTVLSDIKIPDNGPNHGWTYVCSANIREYQITFINTVMTDEDSDFALHNLQHLGLDLAVRYHEDIGNDGWCENRGHYQDFVTQESSNTDLAADIEPKTDFLSGASLQEKRDILIGMVNTELAQKWDNLMNAIEHIIPSEPPGYGEYFGGYIDYYPWDE